MYHHNPDPQMVYGQTTVPNNNSQPLTYLTFIAADRQQAASQGCSRAFMIVGALMFVLGIALATQRTNILGFMLLLSGLLFIFLGATARRRARQNMMNANPLSVQPVQYTQGHAMITYAPVPAYPYPNRPMQPGATPLSPSASYIPCDLPTYDANGYSVLRPDIDTSSQPALVPDACTMYPQPAYQPLSSVDMSAGHTEKADGTTPMSKESTASTHHNVQ
ncbi:uncharacterized protein LOC117100516 [Anneissia japonica]|uniref:uncharacterized protein LOC117100516 n=1 Tax=Anneissia japonica TaxID=1529436 RepID=UPI0014259D60|nr:uncharacterized protein LOC117100516 [Anneissia japonica]XP_033096145.1 uncharacterized protein LOC117100516 [Anneissia japonica]XP_033096146.1 uncharacterized protein LOC117100516 [Anneissia japonica]